MFWHVSPQISLPTTLGSLRALTRHLKDSELGPSITDLSDNDFLSICFHAPLYIYFSLSYQTNHATSPCFGSPSLSPCPLSCPRNIPLDLLLLNIFWHIFPQILLQTSLGLLRALTRHFEDSELGPSAMELSDKDRCLEISMLIRTFITFFLMMTSSSRFVRDTRLQRVHPLHPCLNLQAVWSEAYFFLLRNLKPLIHTICLRCMMLWRCHDSAVRGQHVFFHLFY